eukprot:NODE_496_length_6811_cov_0.672378.p1 type:complete len:677 gc:universal NODE_496_length_6811_cov_0.672378:3262-1232(-)
MGVRGLEYFLKRSALINKDSVYQLRGIRLGIDGTFWLRRLLSLKDPFHIALGKVVPGQLLQQIDKEIAFYESLSIQPIFVFPSLPVLRTELPYSTPDDSSNMRNQGWEQYFGGEINAAQYSFESSKSFSLPELASYVVNYLISKNIIAFRAPFAAIPQLVYLKESKTVHAILASNEIICYNIDKWITEFSNKEFHWVYRDAVLKKIGLGSEQMLDTCLLCGIDSPTFPPIIPDQRQASHHFNVFENSINQILMSGNGYTAIDMAIQSSQQNLSNYLQLFIRYYVFWYFNPVYTREGAIVPVNIILDPNNGAELPKNVADIFGPRLSNGIYYCMANSLINPHLIFQLLSGIVLESPPLCNGGENYRKILSLVHANRGFVFDVLKQFIKTRPSSLYFWYDAKVPYTIKSQDSNGHAHPFLKTKNAIITLLGLNKTLFEFEKATSHLRVTFSGVQKRLKIATVSDLFHNVNLRLLNVLGYTERLNEITPLGKCLKKALSHLSFEMEEGLLIASELLRFGHLNSSNFKEVYPTKPQVKESNQQFINLVSRVCSLINLRAKDSTWSAPLDRNILMFNSIVKLFSKSIRQWNEAILVHTICTEEIEVQGVANIVPKLLFSRDFNCTMGVLLTNYLILKDLTDLQILFETVCKDVEKEVKRAFEFWQHVIITYLGGRTREMSP